MFSCGVNASAHAVHPAAVAGMSCIRPLRALRRDRQVVEARLRLDDGLHERVLDVWCTLADGLADELVVGVLRRDGWRGHGRALGSAAIGTGR